MEGRELLSGGHFQFFFSSWQAGRTKRKKKWRVRTADDNNKPGNSQFDEPLRNPGP